MTKDVQIGIGCVVGMLIVAAFILWAQPVYSVWRAGKAGEAALRRAEHEKMVLIETAKAELEAAKVRAEAIEVVGEMATKYPAVREQEFIAAFGEAMLNDSIDKIIYVPTEGNIPIIEAGRYRDSQ